MLSEEFKRVLKSKIKKIIHDTQTMEPIVTDTGNVILSQDDIVRRDAL